jgi:hypothetical protein
MGVFLLFLLATSLGCLTTLYWIPEEHLGRGYFQMNALVVLGLLALAAAVVLLHSFPHLGGAGRAATYLSLAAAFVYYGAVWRESWRLGRLPLTLALGANLVALLAAGASLTPPLTPLPHRSPLLTASLLTSALVLGWSLIAMLLGHWYLVAPRLTFQHLVLFCRILTATVVARLLAVGASLAAAATVPDLIEPHPLRLLAGLEGQGIFFWFRLLWGLAIPLLLSLMALHCAKQRSNQSATGILYVLVVGTFIGEITGYYLTVTTGVPV